MSSNRTTLGVAGAMALAVLLFAVSQALHIGSSNDPSPPPVEVARVQSHQAEIPVPEPPVVEVAQREASEPQLIAKPRRWSNNPWVDSKLGKIKFSFARKMRNSKQALANDYVNPDGLDLSEEHRAELDAMMYEILGQASKLENAYGETRDTYVTEKMASKDFERVTAEYYQGNQELFQPRNEEEEVVAVAHSANGDCIVRVGWESDPRITADRQAILDYKTQSMGRIVEFVKTHGFKQR